MRNYELVVIIRGSATPDNRKKTTDAVKALMVGAKVTKEDVLGEKALSYQIKHEKSGYYMIWQIEAEVVPVDLERKLYGMDMVIRHLLTKIKPEKIKRADARTPDAETKALKAKDAKETKKVKEEVEVLEKPVEVAVEKPKKTRKKKTE